MILKGVSFSKWLLCFTLIVCRIVHDLHSVVCDVACSHFRSANIQTSSGVTSVYVACQEGRLDIVKFLVLQAGGSIKMQSYDGMSCIHAAAQTGRLSCVQWLVRHTLLTSLQEKVRGYCIGLCMSVCI